MSANATQKNDGSTHTLRYFTIFFKLRFCFACIIQTPSKSVSQFNNKLLIIQTFQQHQLHSRRHRVFPGAISNRRKFLGVVDTLN